MGFVDDGSMYGFPTDANEIKTDLPINTTNLLTLRGKTTNVSKLSDAE